MNQAMNPVILFLLWMLSATSVFGQKYQYGAVFASGVFVRVEGAIEFGDSTVVITSISAGKTSTVNYDLVKRANNLVYFTDGVMTHFFALMEESGKKKGFECDHLMVFTADKRQSNATISYYAMQLP